MDDNKENLVDENSTEDVKDNISDITDYMENDDVSDDKVEEVVSEETDENKIISLNKKIEELTNLVQRTQADFMNYKRRTEEEKQTISLFANERLLIELIDVIDNFDRALAQDNTENNTFLEGVSLIRKQIYNILEKNEVTEIDTSIKFDPNLHYAVMMEESDESETILEVFQKGYMLKNKVIRPAMVKVSK